MPALTEMDSPTLCHWMERFVLEIRKTNGEEYQPNTLYHIVCGIMRYVRMNLKAGVIGQLDISRYGPSII